MNATAESVPLGLPAWVWIVAVVVAAGIAYVGRSLLLPLLVGLLGAYLLNPMVMRLQQRGVDRSSAVTLLFATLTLLCVLGLSLMFSTLQDEAQRLIEAAPTFASHVELALDDAARDARTTWPKLRSVLPAEGEPGWLLREIHERFGEGRVLAGRAGALLMVLILAPAFAYFLLRDGARVVGGVIARIHPRHIETSVAVWAKINLIIGQYLRGLALESAVVGLLVGVGLWALGVPFPLLLGLFAGFVNPVPYVGVTVSLTFAFLAALTAQMGLGSLGAVTALFVVIRLIDDLVLIPLTIGGSVHLHPMFVIVSIVVGEHALGVLGMVLAVPVVTVVKEVARLLLEHRRTLLRTAKPWSGPEKAEHLPF